MDTRRKLYWLGFLGVAGLLALIPEYFFEAAKAPTLQPAVKSKQAGGPLSLLRSRELPAAVPVAELSPGRQQAVDQASQSPADLFAVHSWYVAPARQPVAFTPVAPPVPAAPVSPPLPYAFLGKLDDSQRVRVFLLRGETIFTVSVGDVIEGTYRVERISGTEMTLVYLPLNSTQSLSVGSSL